MINSLEGEMKRVLKYASLIILMLISVGCKNEIVESPLTCVDIFWKAHSLLRRRLFSPFTL